MAIALDLVLEFRRLFTVDAEGVLVNRVFRSPNALVGQLAGFDNGNGYRRVRVLGRQYYIHQVVWALHHGIVPDGGEIDHKDLDSLNNRIGNLRLTDHYGNMQNTSKRAHSSQPYKGVRRARNGKWLARITCRGQTHHLGAFLTPEAAYEAYCRAAVRLHGEFARAA